MTTPPDLVLVPRESISISGYRGDKTLLERLQETPLPSLNRICQDRKDAAHFIEAMIASAPSQEGGWRTIDSAPKDGTLILLYRPMATETGDEPIVVARGVSNPCKSPQGVIHYTDRCCHPTHWQPLPLPPTDSIRSLKKRDGAEKM